MSTWYAVEDGYEIGGVYTLVPRRVSVGIPEELLSTFGKMSKEATGRSLSGKDKEWCQLTMDEKSAARYLGWDDYSWDAGETTYAASSKFADLTTKRRSEAEILGYNEYSWDKEL